MKKLMVILFSVLSVVLLNGCYTQFAVRENNRSNYNSDNDENYTDSENNNDTNYYSDNSGGAVINNYYMDDFGMYRRYFWHYHPYAYSGIYFGFAYDPFYFYDPFWYDWYNPYPSYGWYYPGHHHGWNDYWGGSSYIHPGYKERTRGLAILRNNDGERNHGGIRQRTSGEMWRSSLSRDKLVSGNKLRDLNGNVISTNRTRPPVRTTEGTLRTGVVNRDKNTRIDSSGTQTTPKNNDIRTNKTNRNNKEIRTTPRNNRNDNKVKSPNKNETKERIIPKNNNQNRNNNLNKNFRNDNENKKQNNSNRTKPPERKIEQPRIEHRSESNFNSSPRNTERGNNNNRSNSNSNSRRRN